MGQELTERDAVLRCQRGDPGHVAFRFLYERYSPEVFGFLKNMLRDRESAEDACQETFFRLHRGLANVDPGRPLRPYVFQVARNVAIDVIRVRRKRPAPQAIEEDQVPPAASRALEEALASERRAVVLEAIAALGPEPRAAIVLRFMHGLSYEEIAQGWRCTVRTVGNRLRAAVGLLERELVRRNVGSLEVES